ncbi:capsular polysaccharide export protein, LipB/KpsS family [Chromobacterium vaccinii]|uniref:capsular polysaccharide export protein, LipB/KpsS family n=1 Tax=Chromobacterium vaccinii TaxID=1108595 RepID=UPI000E14989D|nr:hypothetical protein [Chromobacterium vaccinii]SUX30563.1 Uncharacterised protein [Chromobacterium vaccinii]
MRILFIENRYSTLLWYEAAAGLLAEGHEVHWLVQNHLFAPASINVHYLQYPSLFFSKAKAELTGAQKAIARTDRALCYFGVTPSHYSHYQNAIEAVLDEIKPEIVFGEATQFYELMVINGCKARGIQYISPNATRYPVGRLVFFRDDTFETVGGSGELLNTAEAEQMLDQIICRSIKPSYMVPPNRGTRVTFMRMWEQLRVAYGWLIGERYATPAPWVRLQLGRLQSLAKGRWEKIAIERTPSHANTLLGDNKKWVLYPLQLQPESNIDVFGQPWNDQAELVSRMAKALADIGASLVVKPNPKSKYEMNEVLLQVVDENRNIIPLPHSFPMQEIFNNAPLVVSVTGTVILERIFSMKPVAVLGSHAMSQYAGVSHMQCPEQVSDLLQDSLTGDAPCASRSQAIDFLQMLHTTSYDALLWDPIARPDLFDTVRLEQLRKAFCHLIAIMEMNGKGDKNETNN